MLTAISYRFPGIDLDLFTRLVLLFLALAVLLPAVAVAINLVWPVLVAFAGKALVAGGSTSMFVFVFRPKGV